MPQPVRPTEDSSAIRVAVIGRPNVGKSTLVNRLIGEERVIASELPGTTRDSILVPFERDGREFVLVDTAGVRRRARVEDAVERASVAKTLQAIAGAHVVIMMLDAHEGIGEQDASVLGQALERGRVLLIAINKWDGIAMDQRDQIRHQLSLKLDFVPFAPLHFISARHGTGVGELARDMIRGYDAAMRELPTPEVMRTLERALEAHQPPLVRGRRIKLRYAHQGGRNPPRIVIHGNQTTSVPEAYRRYLANVYREAFDLFATPVAIEFRTDANPYERLRAGKAIKGKRVRGRQEQCRVDELAVERDAEVQMRTGHAPGGPDLADDRAAPNRIADADADGRQMAVHGDQPLAVVDEHRVAVEEVAAGVDHRAIRRGVDRCAGGGRDVHARVRRA